jgi:hypothetical protein
MHAFGQQKRALNFKRSSNWLITAQSFGQGTFTLVHYAQQRGCEMMCVSEPLRESDGGTGFGGG